MTPLDFFQEKIDMLKDERKMEEIEEIGEINFLKTMMDELALSQKKIYKIDKKIYKIDNERKELVKMFLKLNDLIHEYEELTKSLRILDENGNA